MDPRMAYQYFMSYNMTNLALCKDFWNHYQRMALQKLSDASLESILWSKVPDKLQKEVGQMNDGSLQ